MLTFILLFIIFVLSVVVGILYWYSKKVVKEWEDSEEDTNEFKNDTKNLLTTYMEHLETVYKMDRFYHDETLQGLLDHSKFVAHEIRNIYGLGENIEKEDVLLTEKD